MTTGPNAVIFVGAAAISLSVSILLVSRLERLGEHLGLSDALLGLVAALAADAPEITSAATALTHHQGAVGTGVILGSNTFNLAALIGLSAIVAGTIALHRRVVVLSGIVTLWVSAFGIAAVLGDVAPTLALVASLAALIAYVAALWTHRAGGGRLPLPRRWDAWLATAVVEEELEIHVESSAIRHARSDAAVAGCSLVVVVLVSVVMERVATTLGTTWKVPSAVVGGIVLAAVTSLPNAVAAIYLARKGRGAAMLSTALNSNLLNVIAGLLVTGSLLGLARPSGPSVLIAYWLFGLTVATLVIAYVGRGLRRTAGWAIVVAYLTFCAVLLAIA